MKLFARGRRARRIEKDLGTGLWRQAHDRYQRGLDRYHQILEGISDDELHNQLVPIADSLSERLDEVYQLCKEAHQRHPADGMLVPGASNSLHSSLSRASNHLATTAEAAAMVRLNSGSVEAVRRRAEQVLDSLDQARSAAGQ